MKINEDNTITSIHPNHKDSIKILLMSLMMKCFEIKPVHIIRRLLVAHLETQKDRIFYNKYR